MKASARLSIAWLAALGVALVAAGACWKLYPVAEWLELTLQRIRDLGPWAIVAYFALYLALEMAAFPNTPLNIGAGLLFSFAIGASLAVIATLLASMGAFLFARYLAQEWTRQRLNKLPSFQALSKSLERGPFQIVLLARLNPLIPASVKNYGFALTEVSFTHYSLASFLGQTPIVLAYVYLGWAGGVAMLRGDQQPSGLKLGLLIAGAILSVGMVVAISWYGRRKASQAPAVAERQ